jgi:hypothetical protein
VPTKRQRRTRDHQPDVSDAIVYLLEFGRIPPKGLCDTWFDAFELSTTHNREARQRAWEAVRLDVLADWIETRPGTRPHAWWEFDAPEPQRRRVGGIGDDHAVGGWHQDYSLGLPNYWFDPWLVTYYNGAATNIHGAPIGTEYHAGDFPYVAYDANDPPTFESQATYLQRHGLLTPAERRRVPPDAFAPEAITDDDEPEAAS